MLAETFVDKRLFERMPCSLVGQYESYDGVSGEVKCQNISALGVKVSLVRPLPIGRHIRVSILIKKGLVLSAKGSIRWCKRDALNWSAGVTFDKPLFLPLESIV